MIRFDFLANKSGLDLNVEAMIHGVAAFEHVSSRLPPFVQVFTLICLYKS
jgi:hypothetical protein